METTTVAGRLAGLSFSTFRQQKQAAEAFRRDLAQWFYAATQCRLLIPNGLESTEEKQWHRGFLMSLISWGEWAQLQIREERIDLSPIGISKEDVAAETRLLMDTYRSVHENVFSQAEAETVLKEVFG